MDVGTVERGIVVRIDGEGKINIQHDGLDPVAMMGLLAMAQVYLMDDLQLRERIAGSKLLDAVNRLKAMRRPQ